VATLAGHLGTMVTWFWASLNLSQAALEALGQYVEVIGDLVDLIADAIEALGLIAAYSGDTAALGPAIAAFSADLMLLVQTLAAAFASASVEARAAILTAGDFADAVGDILGGGFPFDALEKTLATHNVSLKFRDDDLDGLLDGEYGKRNTFSVLAAAYPALNTQFKFHLDHIFPKSGFDRRKLKRAGYSDDDIESFRVALHYPQQIQLLQ
jgi:hypothetical protein